MQRGRGTGGPAGHVDVDLADPVTGEHLPGPRVGEPLVRSPSVFLGFWCDRAVTDRALRSGWPHTGDLARRDVENVSPAEVESVLHGHPAVAKAAGVGQGTFYLYFSGKLQIFEELVDDLNRRVRHAMSEASAAGSTRIESERMGFRAFFRFTAEHPTLYRIIRQAEPVAPDALRRHHTRIVAGYTEGLTAAAAGQIAPDVDPVVAACALMGIGELVDMRWVLWDDATAMPPPVFDEIIRLVQRALGARDVPGGLR